MVGDIIKILPTTRYARTWIGNYATIINLDPPNYLDKMEIRCTCIQAGNLKHVHLIIENDCVELI